jgi:TolA-binding protein
LTLLENTPGQTAGDVSVVHYLFGIACVGTNQYQKAEGHFRAVITAGTAHIGDAHYCLGYVFLLTQRYNDADREFLTVLNEYPDNRHAPEARKIMEALPEHRNRTLSADR